MTGPVSSLPITSGPSIPTTAGEGIWTARDIIRMVLKNSGVIGVGQDPLPEDTNDCFMAMNLMLSTWAKKRWFVYHEIDVACQATGALSYTVGMGGDFDTPRPDKIEAAYVRMVNVTSNRPDYPLVMIQAREDYSRITLKTMNSFPTYCFYDSDYPVGNLYAWPVPSSLYEIHIVLKEQLTRIANLSDTIALPPEYAEAIIWNLARRIRPAYQLPPDPQVNALARETFNAVIQANVQIARLQQPPTLLNKGRYNIYADRTS